jgi:hypothetical protein
LYFPLATCQQDPENLLRNRPESVEIPKLRLMLLRHDMIGINRGVYPVIAGTCGGSRELADAE